jgi:hypothetical protein
LLQIWEELQTKKEPGHPGKRFGYQRASEGIQAWHLQEPAPDLEAS